MCFPYVGSVIKGVGIAAVCRFRPNFRFRHHRFIVIIKPKIGFVDMVMFDLASPSAHDLFAPPGWFDPKESEAIKKQSKPLLQVNAPGQGKHVRPTLAQMTFQEADYNT